MIPEKFKDPFGPHKYRRKGVLAIMGRKKFAELQWIDNSHPITKETDQAFLYLLQSSLLLALKELGQLNEIQYRNAEEQLKGLQRKAGRMKLSGNEHAV